MSVWLLANIGNSDLQLTDTSLLPRDGDPNRWKSSRRLGEELRDHLDRYRRVLHMPLLEPTLRWLFNREKVTGPDLKVVLFASDQPREYTVEEEWLKDTAPIAEVIQALLTGEDFQIPKKNIRIERIDGNPADYSNMLNFYSRILPEVSDQTGGEERLYMEVSGGTPAMTSMLIVMGVEVFGERVRTLYVDRGANRPYEVSVAHELFARKTRDTLRHQVELHAYAVARRTLEQSGVLISSDDRRRRLLDSLLEYADRRLAFDFERARAALQEARGLVTGEQQARIQHWMHELESPDSSDHLSELIHSASIKLRFGDYADFVQRVFRFQEATFRYMLDQFGVQYSNREGKFIRSDWLKSQSGLSDFLKNYRNPSTGDPDEVKLDRPLNRFSLGAIVDFFVEKNSKWKRWQTVAQGLHRLSAVADLRNKGISGHGFDGIGQADLQNAYGESPEKLLAGLSAIYQTIFGKAPGPNPYDAINALILDLIQASA
ncbi:MAG: hypothetical protein JW910_08975 [Anaerolineae bacterium]|nr:hypothetical protein [Anaerolineae bacterium]